MNVPGYTFKRQRFQRSALRIVEHFTQDEVDLPRMVELSRNALHATRAEAFYEVLSVIDELKQRDEWGELSDGDYNAALKEAQTRLEAIIQLEKAEVYKI
jgi:hypothetical protein